MRHDMYLHRVGRGTKERGDKTQTKEGGRAREIFILVGVLWPPMLLPGTEPRRWVLGRWISFPRRLDNKSPYKNLRSNLPLDLLKASSLGSAACLDQKRTRYPILKECFTPRSTFYASVLESCILRPGHAREVSHSHNRIHREFSIMFQLTSMGKHDAITRDHSVQMKRHFLVQPQRYPFPKLACSVGPSSGDMAVQFTLTLPIRVGRSQEGGRELRSMPPPKPKGQQLTSFCCRCRFPSSLSSLYLLVKILHSSCDLATPSLVAGSPLFISNSSKYRDRQIHKPQVPRK